VRCHGVPEPRCRVVPSEVSTGVPGPTPELSDRERLCQDVRLLLEVREHQTALGDEGTFLADVTLGLIHRDVILPALLLVGFEVRVIGLLELDAEDEVSGRDAVDLLVVLPRLPDVVVGPPHALHSGGRDDPEAVVVDETHEVLVEDRLTRDLVEEDEVKRHTTALAEIHSVRQELDLCPVLEREGQRPVVPGVVELPVDEVARRAPTLQLGEDDVLHALDDVDDDKATSDRTAAPALRSVEPGVRVRTPPDRLHHLCVGLTCTVCSGDVAAQAVRSVELLLLGVRLIGEPIALAHRCFELSESELKKSCDRVVVLGALYSHDSPMPSSGLLLRASPGPRLLTAGSMRSCFETQRSSPPPGGGSCRSRCA